MTNDEITVVLDYLDETIKNQAKEIEALHIRIDKLEKRLANTEGMAQVSFMKGLF